MSAKRQRSKPRSKRAGDAIPAEILAEGSGPNEVVDATPQTLVEAAEDLVEKRKGRKRKAKASETAEAAETADASAASDEGVEGVEGAEGTETEKSDDDSGTLQASVSEGELDSTGEVAGELDAAGDVSETDADQVDDENPDHANAFDAAAGNAPPDMSTSAEGDSVAAVEEAVMRAEAEAELGDAEDVDAAEDEELGATLPTTAASMDAAQLKNLVEALVFAADKPVTIQRLRQLTRVGDVTRLEQALVELAADYTNRGLVLQQVSGGYQFRTNTQYSVWVQQLIAGRPVRLSRAQLETLAIVAYRQPITRPEIDDIRGVDSSATLRLLLDRALIRTLGKKEDVGRPMLYGTTKEFLDFFSLGDLRELPTLREYSELTAESRKVMTDRLGVDPAGEPANDEMPEDVDAKPAVEVDAWGQVINIPAEEPAVADSTGDEVLAAEGESVDTSASTDVSDDALLASDGDESSETQPEESTDLDDESVEMSASTDVSAEADDRDQAPAVRVDAWGQVISTEDAESDEDAGALSAAEGATVADDEPSESGDEVSAETGALSASEDDETNPGNALSMSGEDVSAETGELSASEHESVAGDGPSVSGEDVPAEASDLSASEGEANTDDEQSLSDGPASAERNELSMSGEDVSAETGELSASEHEAAADNEQSLSDGNASAGTDELSESNVDAGGADQPDADMGAPAGGTMEDRIDLAGSDVSSRGDDASDEELSADDASEADADSLHASPDDVVASEERDETGEPGDEPSSRD